MTAVIQIIVIACLVLGQWAGPGRLQADGISGNLAGEEAASFLHHKIDRSLAGQPGLCRGDTLCSAPLMLRFYRRHDFRPVWNTNGRLSENVRELVAVLDSSGADGLKPADYHFISLNLFQGMLARLGPGSLTPSELADLDLLLTDAFLSYGSHLLNGRVNPREVSEQWLAAKHDIDLTALLDTALADRGVKAALTILRPPQAGYRRMMAAWSSLYRLVESGGWPELPTDYSLQEGMQRPEVSALRQRLMISGDYPSPIVPEDQLEDDFFDGRLAAAVRLFQMRHGLGIDGIAGRRTLAALNVPASERLRQLELNMERYRWLPHDLGRRYLLVNIPDFSLQVIDDSRKVLEMRVVAGKPHRKTPVFSDMVEYLVVNPYWYLPETIIVEDVLPLVLSDPEYLHRERIKIFAAGSDEQMELDQTAIDWRGISKENLPFKLRQDAGPLNALGRLKIVFPNRFSVYLHDTPRPGLFRQNSRDFSSGCIRLEKPLELANYLLEGNSQWNREGLLAAMEGGARQVINLAEPVPIHILYLTAWVDEEGTINFRRDIYGWDKLLTDALRGKLPEPDPACVDMKKI